MKKHLMTSGPHKNDAESIKKGLKWTMDKLAEDCKKPLRPFGVTITPDASGNYVTPVLIAEECEPESEGI